MREPATGPKAGRAPGRVKEIVTPEGMRLDFRVAPFSERAAALAIDVGIIAGATLLVVLLALYLLAGGGLAVAIALVAAFLIRTFYFTWFEVRWKGSTPGKRLLKLRVIQADGAALATEAVVARNLMRDLELFLPLTAFLAMDSLWPEAPEWARLAAIAWLGVFVLLPLFNRDRLRIGDLVAGTLVVHAPRALLLQDLGTTSGSRVEVAYAFTPEQLDVYGIYELQVLEDVLRNASMSPTALEALEAVADRIKTKIAWDRAAWQVDSERFLRAFYTALRAQLEKKMLFGKRKADKFAR